MGSSGISMRMNREKEEETDVWGGGVSGVGTI